LNCPGKRSATWPRSTIGQVQESGDASERRTSHGGWDANLPARYPFAPENRDSPVELRQLPYGERPHVYRITSWSASVS
jgi:hypothetical protein